MNKRAKKIALTTLQVAVTVGILWFIFRDPVKRAEMLHTLRGADHKWLVVGFLCYGVVELCGGIRWLILLRVQKVEVPVMRAFALLLIGVFFSFFIPGGTGGDVVKVFYLLKETPGQRASALLSVLVDRIVGLLSVIVLAAILIGFRWHWLTSTSQTTHVVWTTLAILGFSLIGVFVSLIITSCNLIPRLPAWLPGRDRFAELAMAYGLYARAWPQTLAAFLISFPSHIGYFATFYFAGEAFRSGGATLPSFADLAAVMPVVGTIAMMPISIGGIGVREGLFQIFLGNLCGVSEAIAVLISSTGYLLTLAWGVIGGLVYLLYRPSEHARLSEIRAKVAEVEHAVAEAEIALESRGDSKP